MPYIGNPAVVGDSTNTFKLLDDIQSFTVTFDATDTSVVSISGDTLTFRNHRFLTGQRVTYNDGGGTAIGGLADGVYFIIKVDQNTIKLASSASNAAAGTAINLTSGAAGGSHTLNVAFDSINTKFSATHSSGTKAAVRRAGQISLSINGVIQQPQDTGSPTVGYGVLPGSIIIFSTAPAATDKVFGTFIGEVAPSFDLTDNTVDNFTGDGSTTSFNLSRDVPSSNDVLVTLDGVTQYPTDSSATRSYAVIESTLTFVSAPATGVAIQVRHIGFAGATTSAVTGFYGRQGNAALTSTDDISVQNISGVGATFTSNVNIEGVLTYEDVTNVDSIGIITARAGVLVGSGITLSKDGDGFFTGIVTATSFSGSGANLTGIDTDLVSDTSPQLGGNLDVNTKNITFGDSGGSTDDRLTFGAGTDLSIYHDGTHSNIVNTNTSGYISVNTDNFRVQDDNGSENILRGFANGAVELYHDNTKRFETTSSGVEVFGELQMDDGNSHIKLIDGARIDIGTGADLRIYHSSTQNFIRGNATASPLYIDCCENVHIRHIDTDGSNAETMIKAIGDGNVELYSNNEKRLQTRSGGNSADGIVVYGNSSNSSVNLFTDTTIRGTLYANSSNLIGFLDNTGQWAFSVAAVGGNTISYNNFVPSSDNGLDLGSSSKRWQNVYTTDLQLSNEGSTNDIDGTWGNYTIQEGESDLFLINNRSGKKYKFNLTEVS